MAESLEEMSEDELLDAAGAAADTIREAEALQLRIAYQWAITHGPDRLDPDRAGLPGREKARMFGGDGTPTVSEFAAAALGARLRITTWAAQLLMGDALDLHHRSTKLWSRVEAGEVKASYARHVVKQTRSLSQEEASFVDAAVVESADGRIPWTRFEALVEAKVAQAAPEAARQREEKAAKATFARKLRADEHGMGSYLVRAPLPVIDQIAATVDAYAAAIAEDHPELSEDERAVHALLLLVTPGSDTRSEAVTDGAPLVTMYVHTYLGPDATPVMRLEGHGPVTDEWVRETLGPTCRFKIQPVLDLAGQAPVDAYEIPDRHRQAVHLMTPADTFPFASSTSRTKEVDHTIPYDEGGESGVGNYGPMTRNHHRIKTHGPWQVVQPFPGIYLWRDDHGATYLIDNTGTRQLTETPALPIVVEIYRQIPELHWGAA